MKTKKVKNKKQAHQDAVLCYGEYLGVKLRQRRGEKRKGVITVMENPPHTARGSVWLAVCVDYV